MIVPEEHLYVRFDYLSLFLELIIENVSFNIVLVRVVSLISTFFIDIVSISLYLYSLENIPPPLCSREYFSILSVDLSIN